MEFTQTASTADNSWMGAGQLKGLLTNLLQLIKEVCKWSTYTAIQSLITSLPSITHLYQFGRLHRPTHRARPWFLPGPYTSQR